MEKSARFSRDKGPHPGGASSAGEVKAGRDSGEGHMGAIRVFVVLCWVFFALRQIFLKPVKALAGRDSQSR